MGILPMPEEQTTTRSLIRRTHIQPSNMLEAATLPIRGQEEKSAFTIETVKIILDPVWVRDW